MSAHKVAINPKTLIAEKGLFLGLSYILCYFSYEDMLLEMFAAVRMFAVGLQSTEGELVQHACEQQNQVVLILLIDGARCSSRRLVLPLSGLPQCPSFSLVLVRPSPNALAPLFQWVGMAG